jgi:hypothetical protein
MLQMEKIESESFSITVESLDSDNKPEFTKPLYFSEKMSLSNTAIFLYKWVSEGKQ